ncbi:MAG: hypothetical protein PVH31_04560, partial [Ectothiorhodospiraceae bacterium]
GPETAIGTNRAAACKERRRCARRTLRTAGPSFPSPIHLWLEGLRLFYGKAVIQFRRMGRTEVMPVRSRATTVRWASLRSAHPTDREFVSSLSG